MKNSSLILFIAVITAMSSCKKSSDNGKYPFYFSATINGSPVKYEADDMNSRISCGTSQPDNALGFDYDAYEGTVFEDIQDPSVNTIRVHILKYFDHDPSANERIAMIYTGSYPYGYSNTSTSTINGASIDYTDANGDYWNSELGSQTGSVFTITELTDNTTGTSGKIFSASFSCKLYDFSGGSITVTNATIRGKILSP